MMRHLRLAPWGRLAHAAILVATFLVACGRGGGMPMTTDPEPDPEPLPTLVGTWRTTDAWTDYETGEARTSVVWLTFIGERAIAVETDFDQHGNRLWSWASASGWEATETTVTRLWFEDVTFGNDEYAPVHGRVEKAYYWGNDERSVVLMQAWDRTDESSTFLRYERVPDAMPDLVGRWTSTEPDPGSTLTVGADGSVVFDEPGFIVHEDGTEVEVTFRLAGTGAFDPATGFLTLTDATLSSPNGAVGPDDHSHPLEDGTRLAVAPAVDGIMLSDYWLETIGEGSPYGDYWMHLERAE